MPQHSVNIHHTQSAQNRYPRRSHTRSVLQPPGGVRQDNPAPHTARIATREPAPPKKGLRSRLLQTNIPRLQKRTDRKRKTVQVVSWVRPVVKAELERIAEAEGLSVSSVGAAFLEQALQQNLHTQHAALLDPIISKAIGKHMRSYSNRLALLLVRVAYASEQTRSLATNILSRQPDVTPTVLTNILDGSSRAAKRNITHRTPQLKAIIEELEAVFQAAEEGGSDAPK